MHKMESPLGINVGDSSSIRPAGSAAFPRLVSMEAKYRKFLTVIGLCVASTICVMAAISVSFATSAKRPYTPFPNPSTAVLVINVLTQLSVLILTAFVTELNERLRWSLASSSSGLNFGSFIALSRSTGDLGVLRMLIAKAMPLMDRVWLFHVVIRFTLAIILFASINFHPVFIATTSDEEILGGMADFNVSLLETVPGILEIVSPFFLSNAGYLLDSPEKSIAWPPLSIDCRSSVDCLSYVLPGGLTSVWPEPDQFRKGFQDTFVVNGARGYHLEFLPSDPGDQTGYDQSNCRTYAILNLGIMICIKNNGLNACPSDEPVQACSTYLKALAPENNYNFQMRATYLNTSAAYSLSNYSILSVHQIGEEVPCDLPVQDYFRVFDTLFNLSDLNIFDGNTLVDKMSLGVLAYFSGQILVGQGRIWRSPNSSALRGLFAFPLYFLKWNTFSNVPLPILQAQGHYAKETYTLVIAKYSLVSFAVLGVIELVSGFAMLMFCWYSRDQTPNASMYPEFDFGSKIGPRMLEVLGGLGNATTAAVLHCLKLTRVWVREENKKIVISPCIEGQKLQPGERYF